MSDLKGVLNKYAPEADVALGGEIEEVPQQSLRQDLLAVSEKNKLVFYVCVAMLVVLFVAALVLVLLWRDRPQQISGVFAASGLSITGIVTMMFSNWKEKVRTDMLLALLSGSVDPDVLKTVIG